MLSFGIIKKKKKKKVSLFLTPREVKSMSVQTIKTKLNKIQTKKIIIKSIPRKKTIYPSHLDISAHIGMFVFVSPYDDSSVFPSYLFDYVP